MTAAHELYEGEKLTLHKLYKLFVKARSFSGTFQSLPRHTGVTLHTVSKNPDLDHAKGLWS